VNSVASIKNLEEITWVHFEGRIPDVLKLAIPKIRKLLSRATISIEFEKSDRPGLLDLLPFPDVAFYSHTFYKHWQSLHPLSISPLDLFFISSRNLNPAASLVLTAGAEGAYWYVPGRWGQEAAPTREVDLVDSTGAGDTFIAGFIWARGKLKKSVKESTELAVELATRKVAQQGFDGVWDSL
jgi:sugar/nucleoside kinase (ribokinase family)